MNVTIRPERPEETAAIRTLVARAFERAAMKAPAVDPDGAPGEATLVGWLRESSAYEPRLALVAEIDGAIAGHVMCSWGLVGRRPLLGVGPLAVDPPMQRRGVGAALMERTIDVARELGEPALVLLGDPAYYSRFGFVPARQLGICADPAWGDYFQALALSGRELPSGTYEYAEPFNRLG